MDTVLQPTVSGTFYSNNPDELNHTIDDLLAGAKKDRKIPKAIISPHAGLICSGGVAAQGYACLLNARDHFDRVILIGPSHRYPFDGVALTSANFYETPLGDIPINQEKTEALLQLPQVNIIDQAFLVQENALETQLPFLQKILSRFSVIPLLYGNVNYLEVAKVLKLLWNGNKTLIVISTDLSHYHDYDTAKAMDEKTKEAILNLKPDEIGDEQACGRVGIQALLFIAKEKRLIPKLIDIRNSGDTLGQKEQVVGYASFHFYGD